MIIKMLGIEIRTGSDQTDKAQFQQQQAHGTALVIHDPNVHGEAGQQQANYQHADYQQASERIYARQKPSIFNKFNPLKDERLHGLKVATSNGRAKLVEEVIYPPPPAINDVLTHERYVVKVQEFKTELLNRGSFNICTIRDLLELCSVTLNSETKDAYKYLQDLHCVNYSTLPKHTFGLIIACINYVVTEGQSENPNHLFEPR